MKHFKIIDKVVNNMLMQANCNTINTIWERIRVFFKYNVPMYILDDKTLAHIIEISPDWEFCVINGLLDELSYRTDRGFIKNDEFNENLVYDAMEQLGYYL